MATAVTYQEIEENVLLLPLPERSLPERSRLDALLLTSLEEVRRGRH